MAAENVLYKVCSLERWAHNKMAAEKSCIKCADLKGELTTKWLLKVLYNTATAVHRGYYYRQIAGKFETA